MSRKNHWIAKTKLKSSSRHYKVLNKRRSEFVVVGIGRNARFVENKDKVNTYDIKQPVGTYKLRRKNESYPFTEAELNGFSSCKNEIIID